MQQAEQDHERGRTVAVEPEYDLGLLPPGQLRMMPDSGDDLFRPDQALAHLLLCLEGIHLDRQLRWNVVVEQVDEAPSHELGTEAEIGVLGQSIAASRHPFNRLATPDAGSTVEVEECAGAVAGRLFDDKDRRGEPPEFS
jgi:hypothetical protein